MISFSYFVRMRKGKATLFRYWAFHFLQNDAWFGFVYDAEKLRTPAQRLWLKLKFRPKKEHDDRELQPSPELPGLSAPGR